MKIQFLGAVGEVTGSKFLITTNHGKKILLDCGMYQGKGLETDSMNRDLGFNPEEIDIILLSHAHIDHSGLIPYICKLGFNGKIYCTHATRDGRRNHPCNHAPHRCAMVYPPNISHLFPA